MSKAKCYSISTFSELDQLVNKRKLFSKNTVIFIRNYLIKGFGIDWLKTLIFLIRNKHRNHNILFFVDSGYDYGMSIMLINEKINFIKLKSNKVVIKKVNQIAKQNKVLLNPNFIVVDRF